MEVLHEGSIEHILPNRSIEDLNILPVSPQPAPALFPESPAGDTGAPKSLRPLAETPRADTGSVAPRADTGATDLPLQDTPTYTSSLVRPISTIADTGSCPPVAETGSSPSTPETGAPPSNAAAPVPPSPSPAADRTPSLPESAPTPSSDTSLLKGKSKTKTKTGTKLLSPRSKSCAFEEGMSREQSSLFQGVKYSDCGIEKGRLLAYSSGADGLKHVVSYNHDALVNWGGFPGIFSGASVFRLRSSLLKQIFILAVIAVCSFVLLTAIMRANPPPEASSAARRLQEDGGGDGDGDGDGDEEDETGDGASGPIDPKEYWLNQVLPLIELAGYANTLVVFLLGVFISVSIARWWTLRSTHLQGILRATRHLVFSLASILPDPKYKSVRQQMARHAILSFRLVFLCARSSSHHVAKPLGREELDGLEREGFLTEAEKEELLEGMAISSQRMPKGSFDGDIAEIPWLWNCRAIHIMFKAGAYPPPVMAMLHRLTLDARNGIDGVFTQMNVQLPFAYCHLIATLVQGSVLLSAVKCGIMIALSDTWVSAFCEVAFSFCLCTVYLGLLSLSAVIADPFGDDLIDFPAAQMFDQLWQGCSLLEALQKPPECYGEIKKDEGGATPLS